MTEDRKPLTPNQAADKIAQIRQGKPDPQGQGKPETGEDNSQPVKQPKPSSKPSSKGSGETKARQPEATDDVDLEDDAQPETHADEDIEDPLLEGTDEDADLDDEDADTDGEEGEPEANDDEDEPTYTVTVRGEELEVTLSELIAGYSRTEDYSRDKIALKEERKEVEALKAEIADLPEKRKAFETQAQRFQQNAEFVLGAMEKFLMPPKPDPKLATDNPGLYIQMKEKRQEAIQLAAGLAKEIAGLKQREKAEHQEALKQGRARLMIIEPALQKDENRSRLVEYAKKQGFTAEQISNEPNPVLFQFAWKAMKYDEIMARKETLKADPPRTKVKKNSRAPENQKIVENRKRKATLNEHASSGTLNTAAAAIGNLRK